MTTIDELSKKVDNPDEEARRDAIEGLQGMSFEPKILLLIEKALGDTSWRVRKSAVNAAVSFGENTAAVSSIAALMIDVLHSEDNAGLRNSAVECLTRLGMKSVPYLVQNLDDKDHDVRKFIVDTLGDIGTNKGDDTVEIIVNAMIKAAQDPDENVRLSAIEGLGKIGSNKAVQALMGILEKGDIALKFTTLEALGNIGRPIPMKGVYNALNERLLRRAAYDLIGKVGVGGAEAIPYLIDGLKENSTSAREAAVVALYRLAASLQISKLKSQISNLPSSTIERVAVSLESRNPDVKKGAVFVLGLTGKTEAVKPLITALCFDETAGDAKEALIKLGNEALDDILNSYQKQEEKVKALLCQILGEIGSKKHVPASIKQGAENILVYAIKDDYGHIRSNAAKALVKINPERAAPEIINLLQDEFDDVRNAAVDALCLLAEGEDNIVRPAVLSLLSTDDPYVREKAIIVLGRIGGTEDVEKIRLAIKDDNSVVRKAAVLAIEERMKAARGRDSQSFIQDITLALADEDKEVRLAAARALGKIRSREAIEPLLLTLQDEDVWVKVAAVESLGKIGGGDAVKAIKGLVDDENGMVVCTALEAMAKIAAEERQTIEEIKPWAVKCLSHNDTEVVKAAAQVVARIDKEDAVSTILPLLEHADWDIRAQVVDILSGRKDVFIKNCLETHLKVETDDLVKQKIAEALKDSKL